MLWKAGNSHITSQISNILLHGLVNQTKNYTFSILGEFLYVYMYF